jgi:hypothetical protein
MVRPTPGVGVVVVVVGGTVVVVVGGDVVVVVGGDVVVVVGGCVVVVVGGCVVVVVGGDVVVVVGGCVVVVVGGVTHLVGSDSEPVLVTEKLSEYRPTTVRVTVPVEFEGNCWDSCAVLYGVVPLPPLPLPDAVMGNEVGVMLVIPPVTAETWACSPKL